MFLHGTTTAEAKTGYGLRLDTELLMLQALLKLDSEGPVELAITFLGAHAVAPEYKGRPDEYTEQVCSQMLPVLKEWWSQNAHAQPLPFVDVFCETGAFNLDQCTPHSAHCPQVGIPVENPRRRVRQPGRCQPGG